MFGRKNINISFSEDAIKRMEHASDFIGIKKSKITEAIRHALSLLDYCIENAKNGGRLYIETKDGEVKEILIDK